jgi:hypothetical protein
MESLRYGAPAIWHPTGKILVKPMTGPKKTGHVRVLLQNRAAYRDTCAIQDSALPGIVGLLTQVALLRTPGWKRTNPRISR